MKIKSEKLKAQLRARSDELKLAWCELMPDEMQDFILKSWVLVVDDRDPIFRVTQVIPLEELAVLEFKKES